MVKSITLLLFKYCLCIFFLYYIADSAKITQNQYREREMGKQHATKVQSSIQIRIVAAAHD